MKKLKLYIETSVWNFILADDAPEKKQETLLFFEEIAKGEYELYVSGLVIAEISDAPIPIRKELLEKISVVKPEELEITAEIEKLAGKYAEARLVPEKAYRDLVHVAAATVNNMDFLISWNMSHIVRAKTIVGVNAVNVIEGYRDIKICTVLEVLA